jgi:hypothetical protein
MLALSKSVDSYLLSLHDIGRGRAARALPLGFGHERNASWPAQNHPEAGGYSKVLKLLYRSYVR